MTRFLPRPWIRFWPRLGMQLAGLLLVASAAMVTSPSRASEPAARPVPNPETLQRVDADFQLADGAAWDGAARLFVPDVKARTLRIFNLRKPDAPAQQALHGLAISGTAFGQGKLYLADNRGARIATWRPGEKPTTLAQFDARERPNDLTVDAEGNVYVTLTAKGVVRKVDHQGEITDIASGLVTPNGIALAPSDRKLYVSSAKEGTVFKIDLTAKRAPNEAAEPFAQLPETESGYRGDGMCTDRSGNVYVTGAEAVAIFDPSGHTRQTLRPPQRPINVVLAGPVEPALFISTFGGLYRVATDAYPVSPNRPREGKAEGPTSTNVGAGILAQFNQVYHRDGHRELLMDLFTPRDSGAQRPAIVVVHGGGWKQGDKTKFRALALRLAERGYVTAAIEYRLAREAAFPAAIRDCNAATVYLRENAKRWGVDPHRITAVGGSAGGHLVGLMAAGDDAPQLKHPSHRNRDSSLAAAVVMAGPLEIASGPVAERSLSNPEQSNAVLWMRGDVKEKQTLYQLADALEQVDRSMPPTLFLCGSRDSPGRNLKTRERMTRLGIPNQVVVHPGARHGHWNRPDWIGRVVDDIDAFLKQQL